MSNREPAASPEVSPEKASSAAAIIKEFFVDFLGCLVPGFLFTMFAIPVVLWAALICWRTIQAVTQSKPWIAIPFDFVASFRVESLCLLLVVSYVLGFVFYRRDPKVPDQLSVAHILWKDRGSVNRSVVQPMVPEQAMESPWRIASWFLSQWRAHSRARKLAKGEGGQFPYSHLFEYLSARGLDHIADLVPWHGADGHIETRSKMFINILKMRLQYADPQRCGEIIRNEAHVRMMSSVWYAARLLQQVCVVLVVPLVACAYLMRAWRSPDIWGILFVLAALFLATQWLRRTVIKFLHYQRVREIVYVLETAYIANKLGNFDVFAGLKFRDSSTVGKAESAAGVAAGR